MSLEYPLDNQSKGSIENAQFSTLHTLILKGGLPIYTATLKGQKQGEIYLYNLSGTYKLCAYFDGSEKCITLI